MTWDTAGVQAFIQAFSKLLAQHLDVELNRLFIEAYDMTFGEGGGGFRWKITLDGAPLTAEQNALVQRLVSDPSSTIVAEEVPTEGLSTVKH